MVRFNSRSRSSASTGIFSLSMRSAVAVFAMGMIVGCFITNFFSQQPFNYGLLTADVATLQGSNNGNTVQSQSLIGPFSRTALTTEWDPASIEKDLKTSDIQSLASATKAVTVKIPGVSEQYSVPFYTQRPDWLSQRTFLSNIFFCPPNGHEGTITNLIGQLLSQNSEGSFMDVGSNLGFYSLLATSMGHHAYAFDIQPVCLYNLQTLSNAADDKKNANLLHVFNVGMSDSEQTVVNQEGGCDYENFYVNESEQRKHTALDADKAGIGLQVPVVRMDHWISLMGDKLKGPIQVMKMDTEGAEGRIALGMQKTLSTCLIRNFIVELTPAHWYRFGQKDNDAAAIQAYCNLTEKYNYKAYFMFMQKERQPPPQLYDIVRPLDRHPAMPSEKGTGCFGTPYYEILDLRRFIHEYCLEWTATVKREGGSAKGFCGNIWFQKQGC
uniref:Methyltransferase FkbM domain-containing protein n=1 Tax=Amphora coffeiformis TaxID=265554 RepID=A0A7S3L9J0_9STRA